LRGQIGLFCTQSIDTFAIMLNARMLFGAASLLALATALPATAPDDDDFACYTSIVDYSSTSIQYREDHIYTEVSSSQVWEGEMVDKDVPMTTLCDGRPRALESYKTYWGTTTTTFDPPITNTMWLEYDEPFPTCNVDPTACPAIVSAHPENPFPCDMPVLEARDDRVACDSNPSHCFIAARPKQTLYYWPVTTVSGDFCAQNGSTVFASPTSPPDPDKAVVDGFTFTSPTNYLSYESVGAVLHGDRRKVTDCGPEGHWNVIVPITESFYSQGYKDRNSYSFNFADLNTIPVDAFNRQRKCGFEHTCTFPIEGSYTPILPLPTEMLNLEPAWKDAGCQGTGEGYYITPIALATPAPTAKSKLL
jgi:hypothetical protein